MRAIPFLLGVLVLASVLLPRLAVLGATPHTDEGFYLYNALVMNQSLMAGHGLPAQGMLLLYPALLSLLANVDANLFFVFRFVDLLVTIACACVLWRMLQRESGSLIAGALLTAACMLLLNLQPFIMAGFRNSLFAAYIPLLLALNLALHSTPSRRTWLLCGGYVALGVLLRENLGLFALFGGICILLAHGPRPAFQYTIGGTITATLILGLVILLRGNFSDILDAYVEMSALNNVGFAINWGRFTSLSYRSIVICAGGLWVVLLLSLFAGSYTHYKRRWNTSLLRRASLWIAIALIPLIEPLTKLGTLYHYSTCLIGLFGLSALGWRQLHDLPSRRRIAIGFILCSVFLAFNIKFPKQYTQLWERQSAENLEHWRSTEWSAKAVAGNHFLYMASLAQPYLPDDAYLSTGYQVYVAYGATGHLPPSHTLSNLTIAAMMMDGAELTAEIRKCLPAAILIADKDLAANRKLYSVLDAMPEYRMIQEIAPARRRVGAYSGRLYAINPEAATYCKAGAE